VWISFIAIALLSPYQDSQLFSDYPKGYDVGCHFKGLKISSGATGAAWTTIAVAAGLSSLAAGSLSVALEDFLKA